MSDSDFAISLAARNGLLFLRVRVSRTSVADFDAFMAKIVAAFANVEGMDEQQMKSLLMQARQTADDEASLGFVIKRKYSDPDYPEKIDRALRGQANQTGNSLH